MKFRIRTLAAILGAFALCAARGAAQTATNNPAQSFFSTAEGYFTSANTNLAATWTNNYTGQVWTGAAVQNGLGVGDDFGLSLTLKGPVSLESVTRNAGIAGTIVSQQLGLSYSKVIIDTRLTAGLTGLYNAQYDRAGAAVFAQVEKATTLNTFAGLRVEEDSYNLGGHVPIVTVFVGFKF